MNEVNIYIVNNKTDAYKVKRLIRNFIFSMNQNNVETEISV